MAVKVYKPEYPGLYYFDTFTFTTLGTSGNRGPESTKGYANAPWRDGEFSIVDGQQQWTVPATGTYNIVAAGAYGATPGRVVSGDVDLYEGQVLSLLVGQQPTPLIANVADNVTVGGGGGTFVVSDGKPLIVASGGDGGSTSNLFAPSNFSSFSYASTISGDGNTIAGIIKTTVYIYNKINGSWIQNIQTIQLPIVDGADRVENIVLDYTGVTLFINYGNSNYPLQNATYKVYKYSSVTKLWDVNGTVLLTNSLGPTLYSDLSDDGTTIVISFYNADAYVFRYSNGSWPYELFISSIGIGLSLSSDANTLASSSTSGQLTVFKYINGTWDSGVELGSSYPYTIPVCSISGDGNTTVAQYGYTTNLTIIYKYTNGSWDSGTVISTGNLQYNNGPVDVNYDGSVVFYKWSNTKIGVYIDGTVNIVNNGARLLKCTSDGKQFIFSDGFASGPNAVGNTSLFTRSADSQPGSFSPFGFGSGFSGAGYLTDGQETDPFFGFLKPNAYVNGGFGNSYQYGQPGISKEGGFGGGQTCLNLQTNISEITGFANVYPSINIQADAIALDSSGTVVLIGQAALSKATVFRYSDGQWDNGYDLLIWYSLESSVALSSDGNTAVVGSFQGFIIFTYSDGSWTEQYSVLGGFENYFGYSLALNSTGTILFVGAPYSFFSSPYVSVYRLYESTWSWSEYLPMNIPGFGYSLSTSSDGNKVIVGASFYNIMTELTYGDTGAYVFTYTDAIWDAGVSLTKNTNDNGTFGSSVAMNSDGNVALVGAPGGKYATMFTYANELWTPVKTFTEDVYNFGLAVKLADNGATQIIGSTSLVKIYKYDQTYISYGTCSILATGGNILTFPLLDTVVFENLNAPTTTCTAATSVAHGYPYDYEVQITGTNSFNGTWLITAGTSNTFTFQAFGGPTETTGYVSGTTTGISGGGGYTGSAGDGVSGATCYADPSVVNFTDIGATSNSAGYVTVSLIDPTPITLSYDDTIVDNKIYISPSGVSYWYDIVYSPELKRFVTCSSFYNGQGIAYSSDGKQWYRSDYNGPGPLCLGWSSELGLFVVGTSAYVNNQVSNNGINWVSVDSQHRFRSLLWVPFLHKFIGIEQYQNFLESPDGINWDIVYSSPYVDYLYNYSPRFISASSSNVIVCVNSTVYISNDGVNWNTSLTTTGATCTSTYGKGVFFVVTDMFYYYYSADEGQTWSNGILPYTPYILYISAVFTDSLIVVTGDRETFVSRNYSTWTRYPNNGMNSESGGYHASVYNSIDQYIVSVSNREISLSLDGSIWTPADTTFIGALYDNVAYSPETSTVVAVASNGQTSSETGVYTKDGVIWKRIPGLNYFPKQCIWNPLQGLFFLGDYCFDPVSEILIQTYYREWIETTSPRGLLQSYYQQGLNNNFPIGKAFSLSGIIVDTGANVSGGDRVSCSGDTFIKMARYPNGTVYTSTDDINWNSYQLQGDAPSECNRIIYISKYKAFFVLSGQAGFVHKSYDGIEWSVVYQSPGIYLSEMVWCPTFNFILIFSFANNLTKLTFSN
jgi:hypothetical protein